MLAAGNWSVAVVGIVAGGIALGAVLGKAANPHMKDAPEQWWQLTGSGDVADSGDQYTGGWPEQVSMPDSYRPDLDYDAEVWSLPIPAYEIAAIGYDQLPPPLPYAPPPVAYGNSITEQAADQAEKAAEDAEAPEAPPTPEDARKSDLARAGLY